MPFDRAMYREHTPWALWVDALFWGSCVVAVGSILAGWGIDRPFQERFLLAVGIVAFMGLVEAFFGGTTVLVRQGGLRVFLGSLPLLSKRVAYSEIQSTESVRYHPIRDFGGWGLRGAGTKQAWTARGDRALVLHLHDGADIYLGSDNPDRLGERVRMAAGERLGDQR